MLNLGAMYANGHGIKRDMEEAARLTRMAAEAGDAQAMTNLGRMLYYGDGVETNYEESLEWFQKAAALGNEEAESWIKTAEAKVNKG